MRAPLSDDGFLDRSAALETRFAFAAVDAMQHLKIATLAGGVNVI